jgi:hypothetical protein
VQDIITSYTTESILTTLGFPDPLSAARQQARMMLLGRLAHYQATIQQFERTWECTLAEMSVRYESQGDENFEADDDYLEWQWCTDAVETVKEQLAALSVH